MATRKKKSAVESADPAHGFAVVVEELRGHFKVFGEKLGSLDEKVTRLDEKVTRIDEKVTRIDDRLTNLEDKVTVGFARVEHRLGLLEVSVLEIRQDLKKKVDRDEVEPIIEGVLARTARR